MKIRSNLRHTLPCLTAKELLSNRLFFFHSDRCNNEYDCDDKSDEQNCKYLKFGEESYVKELIPRDVSGNPAKVYINISVLAFPNIDTVTLKFTADFYLNLRWYDPRIEFQDLNNITSLNSLNTHGRDSIWTPRLAFNNALGPVQTTVDELTVGLLHREGKPLPEDVYQANEGIYMINTRCL